MNMKSYVNQAAIPVTELLQIELYFMVRMNYLVGGIEGSSAKGTAKGVSEGHTHAPLYQEHIPMTHSTDHHIFPSGMPTVPWTPLGC